jgi:hypothetical protein
LLGLIFCPLGNQSGAVDDTDLGAIVTDNQGHDLSYRTFTNELPPRSSTLLLNPQI